MVGDKPPKGSVQAMEQSFSGLGIDSMLCQKTRGAWSVTVHVWDDVLVGSVPSSRPMLVYMGQGPTLELAVREALRKVCDAQKRGSHK